MNLRQIKPRFNDISAPLALLVLCAIVYLPMVYRLGFYWDDWPSIWFLHTWGPTSFREGFASDRPLLAWIFMLTTPIFGESTSAWQLFSIFTRWLTALAWWWTLRGLWPGRARQVFWIAALFAVYPGFSQQYISVTYSNAYLVFFLFIVSFGAMIWANRLRSWFWPLMALSLITSAFSLFITEYFFGLELLRPILLWILIDNQGHSLGWKIRQVALRWSPYLAILLPFIVWRGILNPSPRAQIILFSELTAAPLTTVPRLILTILKDFVEVNFIAWFHGIDLSYLHEFDTNVIALMVGSIAICMLFVLIYLRGLTNRIDNNNSRSTISWGSQSIFLGVAAFLVSGWTIWITDLHFELLFPFDRFTLITMLGTSLFVGGLIGLTSQREWISLGLVTLLIGVSCGIQFQQRLYYRQEWLSQKNFFWQLLWRAPEIQPGTVLMTSEIPFTYYSDNSLTAPLNWIYAPSTTSTAMAYLLYDIEARLGTGLKEIAPDIPIDMPYRTAEFDGTTSQAIVLFYDPPRCLKVMDPSIDRFLPVKPLYIREATPLSRLDLIQPASNPPAIPPAKIFGPEPTHNWCYYFEKAEFHAQQGEWDLVAEMANQALKINKHYTEKNVSELIPFIMGYAHTGNWKKAVELSLNAYQIWDKTQYPLCDAWKSINTSTPADAEKAASLNAITQNLSCNFQ